jgi:hypothetical protein
MPVLQLKFLLREVHSHILLDSGDFRNGSFDLGWDAFSPEEQERKRAIELNQGRAAMMGILALMVHEMLPSHDPYVINSLVGYPIDFNSGF